MDINYKIKLVEIFRLSPLELDSLDVITLSEESLVEMTHNRYDLILEELTNVTNNSEEKDIVRLIAASLKSRLQWYSVADVLDKEYEILSSQDDLIDDDLDDDDASWKESKEQAKENQKIWKEREKKAKESQKKLKLMSTEDICNEIFNFILNKYPEIENGFNSVLYRSGREDYYEMLGIRYCPNLVSHQEWTKIYLASNKVEELLRTHADSIIIGEILFWKDEYWKWFKSNNLNKVTKTSIISFFKEKGKKVSTYVVDKMKNELTN
jgi:hypothetical protein